MSGVSPDNPGLTSAHGLFFLLASCCCYFGCSYSYSGFLCIHKSTCFTQVFSPKRTKQQCKICLWWFPDSLKLRSAWPHLTTKSLTKSFLMGSSRVLHRNEIWNKLISSAIQAPLVCHPLYVTRQKMKACDVSEVVTIIETAWTKMSRLVLHPKGSLCGRFFSHVYSYRMPSSSALLSYNARKIIAQPYSVPTYNAWKFK